MGLLPFYACAASGSHGFWASGTLGPSDSRWIETQVGGARLVREHGTMLHTTLAVGQDRHGLQWSLQTTASGGVRAYDGQNNRGEALQTESRLRNYGVRAEVWLQPGQWLAGTGWLEPISRGADSHSPNPGHPLQTGWSLGLALEHRRIHREIASAGLTLGYPERFDVRTGSVGLRYQAQAWPWGAPGVELWWGGGPTGRMQLQLPGAQPALLRLGAQQHWRATARWAFPRRWPAGIPHHWQANLRFTHSHDRWGQGPASTIWRSGNPSGGAAQPQTALRENTLMLEVRRDWP